MKDTDFMDLARRRMDDAATADASNREQAQSDLRFLVGDQWDDTVRQERERLGKPCLTFNGLPQFTRRVTSQIRSMNPAVKVIPADGTASEDVAEIMAGLIRQIEYECDGTAIYERAGELAAACGIGWFRIRADYTDPMAFEQEAIIERISNPFAVFCDPMAVEPDRSDARYVFIAEDMLIEDFKETYPDARVLDATSDHHMQGLQHWLHGERVTVAEYYWIEEREVTIGRLMDGSIVENPPKGTQHTRKTKIPVIKWAKISGGEVLEGPTEIPTRYMPVVAVTGEEWPLGEKLYRSSVIRFAKDAQQMYNMARTSNAELIAQQSKAPYMVTPKQIAGFEGIWATAATAARAYLPYNPDPAVAGAPKREMPPVPSQAYLSEIQLSGEDIKRTTGIYDASLGARSNETSGVAIQQRQMEAEASNSIYADNVAKAVARAGRILVDMIPRIYDTQRMIRILGEDDEEKLVTINAIAQTADGLSPINDLTIGKYDIRLSVGPSYQTKREQASEGMAAFVQAYPQAAQFIGDLYAKAQDWPEADRIAERLKKAVPPQILGEEDQDQSPEAQMQRAQEMQAQQAQMQMQQQAQAIEMGEAEAKARQAQANAVKAEAEAMKAQIELQQMQVNLAAGIPLQGQQAPQGTPQQ